MLDLENCKCLNDICRKVFGKVNYYNREKCKKLLLEEGIDWREWLDKFKLPENNEKKHCLYCGCEMISKVNSRKFCSSSCAAKYNNKGRKVSRETRIKVSRKLQENSVNFNGIYKPLSLRSELKLTLQEKGKEKKCFNCGGELLDRHIKFCCNNCQTEYNMKEYIARWKNGEEEGMKGEYGVSNYIRRYLFEKNGNKCEKCGWGETNEYTGKIPLEVHHIDGDYKNNKEENLQLLCPNCHSLTETFKSHNKEGRKARKKYNKS